MGAESDTEDCGLPVSRAERDQASCQQRREPAARVPTKVEACTKPGAPLLQSHQTAPSDECYNDEEVALSEFQRLQSVCATEATSASILQLLGDLTGRQVIQTRDLEKINKKWDDSFLRPANKSIGERPCVCGRRCLGRVIAKMRYGPETDRGFTCVEFLTPKQQEHFRAGKGLPQRKGKCLICVRYFTSYVFHLARLDPEFLQASSNFDVQLFENCVARPTSQSNTDLEADARAVPHAASTIFEEGGYRPDVCLFADEAFLNSSAGRGDLASIAWRPVVRFRSLDYDYETAPDGSPIIVQRRMGSDEADSASASPFVQPPPGVAVPVGGGIVDPKDRA